MASLNGRDAVAIAVDVGNKITKRGRNVRSKRSLNGSAAFGVTESTPDFSISVGWSIAI